MTTIYFIREAEYMILGNEDARRTLTEKGKSSAYELKEFFKDKGIDLVYSSPFLRAIETIKPFADSIRQPIYLVDEFAERKIGSLPHDMVAYMIQQWEDFDYKVEGGESLYEVQERMIDGLQMLVNQEEGKNIIVSTHGTALATVINYFDPTFLYADYHRIKQVMPWMVKFEFDGEVCVSIEEILGV